MCIMLIILIMTPLLMSEPNNYVLGSYSPHLGCLYYILNIKN